MMFGFYQMQLVEKQKRVGLKAGLDAGAGLFSEYEAVMVDLDD